MISVSQMCCRFCRCDLSPVCAIVGGVLGQEVIKVSSAMKECMHKVLMHRHCQGKMSPTRTVFFMMESTVQEL